MTASPPLTWYAVHARPTLEARANEQLKRQGIATFYPFTRRKVRRKVPGRDQHVLVEVERPYFSGYLFVGLRPDQSLYEVNNTPAVSTVIYTTPDPETAAALRIPEPVIDRLMDLTDCGGRYIEPDELVHLFPGKPGDRITFKPDTPFQHFVGEVSSIAELDRTGQIKVWLQLLGGLREVSVSVDAVGELA